MPIWKYNNKYLKAQSGDVFATISYTDVLNKFYPVGTYYTTTDTSFDPNVSFTGTWVRDTDGKVTVAAPAGEGGVTGGEKTHTLTLAECPSHNHVTERVLSQSSTGTYGNDSMSTLWNRYKTPRGNYDAIYYGTAHINYTNSSGTTHNNIQRSMIVIRWHRTA